MPDTLRLAVTPVPASVLSRGAYAQTRIMNSMNQDLAVRPEYAGLREF